MKRLLLAPLLLGFVPSVNAFPWSSDIVVKTDLQEKYVVKESAVKIVDYSKNDLIEEINSLSSMRKYAYKNCVQMFGNEKDKVINSDIRDRSYCEKRHQIWKGEPIPIPTDLNILKSKGLEDITLWKRVTFRPIFVDLNKKKIAKDYERVDCINPKIDVYSLSIADKYLKIRSYEPEKISFTAYQLMKSKVCEKYANFE